MERDPKVVSYTMSRIRGRDTGIELKLRKALRERGVSYRVCSKHVFGHPDVLITDCRIAIFCDSEFWHGYQFEENLSKIHSNQDYWIPKIRRNIERDKEVNERLKAEGYLVLRYWGFEIEKEFDRVIDEVMAAIARRKEILSHMQGPFVRTTLVYVQRDDAYLMLYRNKKKNDINEGKYVGVGGHLEPGESPVACMKREVFEETALQVEQYKYFGKVYFLNSKYPAEVMYLYRVDAFKGEIGPCNEGVLEWVQKDRLSEIPMWPGDYYFLPLLEGDKGTFDMIIGYDGDRLLDVIGPAYKKERKPHGRKKK